MRAVILAAGQGTRLGDLTKDLPKCLVEYRGKSLLERALDSLAKAGVTDVTVVTGYKSERIKERIQGRNVGTRFNPDFATTNMVGSFFCAEDLMADDDLLLVYGDVAFKPSIVRALAAEPSPFALAVNTRWRELWQLRMPDPLADVETMKVDAKGFVTELGKKANRYEDVQGQYTGLFRIKKEALPKVREFYRGLDRSKTYDGKDFRNMYMTSFLQAIIDGLMPIKAVLVDGGWLEVDSPEDLAGYKTLPNDFLD